MSDQRRSDEYKAALHALGEPIYEYRLVPLAEHSGRIDERAVQQMIDTWVEQGWQLQQIVPRFGSKVNTYREEFLFVFRRRVLPPASPT